jgi:hypothetical protein
MPFKPKTIIIFLFPNTPQPIKKSDNLYNYIPKFAYLSHVPKIKICTPHPLTPPNLLTKQYN